MFTTKKIATVSVINDLFTDHRVYKTCKVLIDSGYEVNLIGRKLPGSLPLPTWPFNATRMSLLFKTGPLFYFFFNLRLFFRLLFRKSDLLFANDLDTLLPNYLISKLKNLPLIYDSHELFTEVPELLNSSFKRKIWLKLEAKIIPNLKVCITVNQSIASIFEKKYGVKFNVIRNIPEQINAYIPSTRNELKLPTDKKIILLQGAGINIDRGAEELIDAMVYINDSVLYIIGSGDIWNLLEEKVKIKGLSQKVVLIKKLPKDKLMSYTAHADLGVSIDKNTNANYYYSLPNKIFDYIHAGVPVLASRLPEIEQIITQYQIGTYIDSHEPTHIAEVINNLFSSTQLNEFKRNTAIASAELNWKNERKKYLEILKQITY